MDFKNTLYAGVLFVLHSVATVISQRESHWNSQICCQVCAEGRLKITLNIFYCSKRQKDKTQVKQRRQSSPITYISKYTIEHNDI